MLRTIYNTFIGSGILICTLNFNIKYCSLLCRFYRIDIFEAPGLNSNEVPRRLLLFGERMVSRVLEEELEISQNLKDSSAEAEQIVFPQGDLAMCNTRAVCPRNS